MPLAPGMWTFPGGGVTSEDRSEGVESTLERTLIREVAEEISVDIAGLPRIPAGRYRMPALSHHRAETHFFLVEAGADDVEVAAGNGTIGNGELIDVAWISPSAALERWQRCEWVLPPITRRILGALAPAESDDTDMRAAAQRCERAASMESDALRLYELVPGIFKSPLRSPTLPPATHTCCYLIGGRDMIAIDPASPYDDERGELDKAIAWLHENGRRIVEIWLTHHHTDHVSGAAYLRDRLGVPVAAHPLTAERLSSRVTVDRMLEDGDVLELAGDPPRRVRVVFTPGHAPGHVCIFEECSRFLVAGDMIAGIGTILIEPSEGDMSDYLASLERMKALEPAALLPAHGPDTVGPGAPRNKIDRYIAHRLWREKQVLAALAKLGEAASRDLVPLAYRDVPAAVYPLAERSLIAHLVKLEKDQRVTRAGESWRMADG